MNRTIAVVFAVLILISGAVATAAAFTDGDEVAPGSEVYLDAADSDNGDQYVQIDENDQVRLQFDSVPPGSHTQVDDLFVIGFAGFEDSDDATTVGLESTDDRLTLERMDTGETFGDGTVELQPGESVLFGAVISTGASGFSSTIELTVDVPEEDTDTDSGSSSSSSDADDDDADDADEDEELEEGDGETPDGATGGGDGGDGVGDGTGDDDGASAGDDGDPGAGAGPGELIELAGFGAPISLGVVGAIAAMLTLSYVYRLRVAASIAGNLGGPGQ